MSPAVLGLLILLIVVVLFVTEWIPLAITAVLACCAMVWLQVTPFSVAFSGFGNDTLWLIMGMIMVGAALFETGLADAIGNAVINFVGSSEKKIIMIIYPLTMAMSAFLNNSSTAATLTPVVQAISAKSNNKVSAKRLLMPLAFAASAGGMLTLVGSPPNAIVHGVLISSGFSSFGFFEWAYLGLPICLALLIYVLTIGRFMANKMWPGDKAMEANVPIDVLVEEDKPKNSKKMIIAGLILIGCVAGFIIQPQVEGSPTFTFSLGTVAVTGAMLCVVFRLMSIKRLYELTDWNSFFIFGGALGFASGLDKCGTGQLIADTAIAVVGGSSAFIIFAAFCLVAMVLTQMMSNTATTAMMAPIGIFVATGMGFSPLPLLMGLAACCSSAYMTPVGTPPNTIVLGPGKYTFMDYVKMGGIFQIISFILIVILVPIIWPL